MILTAGCQTKIGKASFPPKIWRIMKLTIVLILVFSLQVDANDSEAQKITIVKKHVHLSEVFKSIENQTGYLFFYDRGLIQKTDPIDVTIRNATLDQALRACLEGQSLTWSLVGKTVVIRTAQATARQSAAATTIQPLVIPLPPPPVEIHGRVVDAQGNPLANVSVVIAGTTVGTTTNTDGRFSITAPDNKNVTLEFSSVGFVAKKENVGNRTQVNVVLETANAGLDEVVVIGYGTQKRSEITGSIATVQGEDISSPSGDIQNALQGHVAGLNITPTSGMPGSSLDMNVRGISTFGNSNPLFVIDGIPIISEGASRNFNPLAGIPIANIESVQILKDASASAIYGARAANGVVIVTTNRGKVGENRVKLDVSGGISKVSKFLPLMNSSQYIEYATDAYKNAGRPIPISFQEPLLSENLKTNSDWQKEGFHSASLQDYLLGVSGGNNNSVYSMTGEYLNQGGTLPNSGFKRYSLNVNTDFKIGRLKKIKIGETIGLSRSIWTGTFNQASYDIRQLLQQSPTVPVYDPEADGGFDGPRLKYSPVGRQNSIGTLKLRKQKLVQDRLLASGYFDWEVLPGLSNHFSVSADLTIGRNTTFMPTFVMGDRVNSLATLDETRDDNNVFYVTNTTTYEKKLNDHKITAMIGLTQQKSKVTQTSVSVRNFQSNDLQTIAAAFEKRDIQGLESEWALRSQMARLTYQFKDKINVMGVIRRDGSSRFGVNNRYGHFPSISANWIVSKEPFLRDLSSNLMSNLTFRASYGKVGSQEIDDYSQFAIISPNINYVFGGSQNLTPGATFLNMGNSSLKWETTTQSDVGLDLGLLENRLTIVMDYYVKNTDDILVQLPIPTTSGIRRNNGPFVNAGSVKNSGFELLASYRSKFANNLKYSVSGNISFNKNRVTSLNKGQPIIARLASGKQAALTITQKGGELGAFYGYVMEGVFSDMDDLSKHPTQVGSSEGDIKFKDINNDGVIDANDQTVIGSPFPNFIYGVNASLEYRGFDLSIFLVGKQGQQLYNLIWSDLNEGEGDNNATTEQLKRWTPSNRNTDVPRAVTGNPGRNTRSSSRFIEDASFLRLQNLQIGYSVRDRVINRVGISSLRFYLSTTNLFTVTNYKGYNPDIGKLNEGNRSTLTRGIDFGMYPIPRVFEGGIQIAF